MSWHMRRLATMPALLLAGMIVAEAVASEAASKPSGGEVRPAPQDVWSDLESMSAKDFQALVRRMTDNDPQETLFAAQEQVRDLAKDTFRGLPVVVLKRHLKDLIVLLDSDNT